MRIGLTIELNWDALFASDMAGRARAFQSLVAGGMSLEAAAASGILAPSGERHAMRTWEKRCTWIRATTRAFRSGAVVGGVFAVMFAFSHAPDAWAQDDWVDEIDEWLEEPGAGWLDERTQALLETLAKTACENECGSGQHCFTECFDEQYELYVWELDNASRIERRQTLDMLAQRFRPDLMTPAHRERLALQEKRQRCHAERQARIDSCYEALSERKANRPGVRYYECEDIWRSESGTCMQMPTAESPEYKSCISAAEAHKNRCYAEGKQIIENYERADRQERETCDALSMQLTPC